MDIDSKGYELITVYKDKKCIGSYLPDDKIIKDIEKTNNYEYTEGLNNREE